jgi:cytochrome c oxidase subunit 1
MNSTTRRPAGTFSTTEPRRLARLYLTAAGVWFVLGGIEALALRLQLARPGSHVLGADLYHQLLTMHATTMVFLALLPCAMAMFLAVVPAAIGSDRTAFPRLGAFALWLHISGGVLLNLGWCFGGSSTAGGFGYPSLTAITYAARNEFELLNDLIRVNGVDFWATGLGLITLSCAAAALDALMTVLLRRRAGLRLAALPPFAWTTLVTSALALIAFPLMLAALTMLQFDRLTGTHFFLPESGVDPARWGRLFALYGHPQVYLLMLPAMGIVSEVLAAHAGRRLHGGGVIAASVLLIGVAGAAAWLGPLLPAVGGGVAWNGVLAPGGWLAALSATAIVFSWLAGLWGGRIELRAAMLFALGFVALFVLGGLSGALGALMPADGGPVGTSFGVGHLHYMLVGGSLMGFFAGTYHWFPKFTGRALDERLGRVHFGLAFVGVHASFLPMLLLGLAGMPRQVYTYGPDLGLAGMNLVATLGSFLFALATLVFLVNVIRSTRGGRPSPAVPDESPQAPGSHGPLLAALGVALLASGSLFGWFMGVAGAMLLGIGTWRTAADARV